MVDTYPQVTITPFRRPADAPIRYNLSVNEPLPQNLKPNEVVLSNVWVRPGDYDTPEQLLASFSPSLPVGTQQAILQKLQQVGAFTFSLDGVLSL